MSVQINGINVIDDDRNFSAAGIVTVGTGNSATIIDGTTGITSVGIGITMEGVPGNISIAGTLTAAGFNIPVNIASFSPANGATNVAVSTSIMLTFDQAVGTGTTGYLYLREGSAGGTTIETFGISDVTIVNANTLSITPTSSLDYSVNVYTVIEEGFIKSTSGDFVGLNTTGADSYYFTTGGPALGIAYEGGYLVCQSGGTRWIVAPASTQVTTSWYSRGNAITTANANAACGDWFIPSQGQLGSVGHGCRNYWDSYSTGTPDAGYYWSNTQELSDIARAVHVQCGYTGGRCKQWSHHVRAIRCVSY